MFSWSNDKLIFTTYQPLPAVNELKDQLIKTYEYSPPTFTKWTQSIKIKLSIIGLLSKLCHGLASTGRDIVQRVLITLDGGNMIDPAVGVFRYLPLSFSQCLSMWCNMNFPKPTMKKRQSKYKTWIAPLTQIGFDWFLTFLNGNFSY